MFVHVVSKVLPNVRVGLAQLGFRQAEHVDHHHPARALGEVAAVEVGTDVAFQARGSTEAQRAGLMRRDDEAGAVKLHARTADAVIGTERQRPIGIGACRQVGVDPSRGR